MVNLRGETIPAVTVSGLLKHKLDIRLLRKSELFKKPALSPHERRKNKDEKNDHLTFPG